MIMYKCDCCGNLFVHPDSYQEYRGECFGFPSYETLYCSPCCSEDFKEVECDNEGIVPEVELEDEVYDSTWYYENCNNKCSECRFLEEGECLWKA